MKTIWASFGKGVTPYKRTQIAIDPTAPHAPKLIQALNVWSEMRQRREAGEITYE